MSESGEKACSVTSSLDVLNDQSIHTAESFTELKLLNTGRQLTDARSVFVGLAFVFFIPGPQQPQHSWNSLSSQARSLGLRCGASRIWSWSPSNVIINSSKETATSCSAPAAPVLCLTTFTPGWVVDLDSKHFCFCFVLFF